MPISSHLLCHLRSISTKLYSFGKACMTKCSPLSRFCIWLRTHVCLSLVQESEGFFAMLGEGFFICMENVSVKLSFLCQHNTVSWVRGDFAFGLEDDKGRGFAPSSS